MSDGSITSALGTAGAGVSVFIDNEEWTLSPLTQGMKSAFESWVTAGRREAALETEQFYRRKARDIRKRLIDDGDCFDDAEREHMVEEVRDLEAAAGRQMSEFNDLKAARKFHFNDYLCQEALGSFEGSAKILQLMLRPKHPNVTLEKASELHDKHNKAVRAAMKEVQGLGKSKPAPQKESSPGE